MASQFCKHENNVSPLKRKQNTHARTSLLTSPKSSITQHRKMPLMLSSKEGIVLSTYTLAVKLLAGYL